MTDRARTTDTAVLRGEAYADSSLLDDRRNIYAFREPPGDFTTWVLEAVPLDPGARLLDLGCGPGQYLEKVAATEPSVRMVGADLSLGMLRQARTAVPSADVLSLDAARLPFADDSFDVVLANHMLYHVADIEAAVAEVRRVLRPGGLFSAVTNGVDHLVELDRLLREQSGDDGWLRSAWRFSLENGRPFLATAFDDITERRFAGELRVPSVEPVVRYIESMRALTGAWTGDRWAAIVDGAQQRVAEVIEREGRYTISTIAGAFVCR